MINTQRKKITSIQTFARWGFESRSSGPQANMLIAMPCHFTLCLLSKYTTVDKYWFSKPDNCVDVGLEDCGVEAGVVDGRPQVGITHLPVFREGDQSL